MIRETLSVDRLRAMKPAEAAAALIVRGSDDPAGLDQELVGSWLALDDNNRRAWERTQRAWLAFDEADNEEALAGLRREALRARYRRAPWIRIAAAAALVGLALTALWAFYSRSAPPTARRTPPPALAPAP